jgi:hypothetical protein
MRLLFFLPIHFDIILLAVYSLEACRGTKHRAGFVAKNGICRVVLASFWTIFPDLAKIKVLGHTC